MIKSEKINFLAKKTAPNPFEATYWVDLNADPDGSVIKTFKGPGNWVSITNGVESGYTKEEADSIFVAYTEYTQTINNILESIDQIEAGEVDAYTKAEVDELLDEKADKSDIVDTTTIQNLIDQSVSTIESTVSNLELTVNNIDADISGKADKATTIAGYGITDAYISDGTIVLGTESITPLTEASLDEYVTETELEAKGYQTADDVATSIANLVDSAPETLDTLKELADALGNDPNFATTITNLIGTKADADDIPTNVSELVNDAGYITEADMSGYLTQDTADTIYATKEEIPTVPENVSAFTNDAGYITSSDLGNYLQSGDNVSELVNDAGYITEAALADYAKSDDLSDYLTKDEASSTYVTESAVEGLETSVEGIQQTITEIQENITTIEGQIPDLSGYATTTQLEEGLATKQDTLVSGTSIKTINGESLLGSGNIEIVADDGGITDAPSDGNLYGRQDGTWVTVNIPDTSEFVTDTELTEALGEYAKTTDIPDTSDMLTKTEASTTYQPIGDYLTSIPEEYVTETELTTALGDYALSSEIPTSTSELTNDSGYITSDALTDYVTKTVADSTYQPIGDYAETTDLDAYLTKTEAESTYATITDLDSKQDTLVSGTNIKTINGETILGSGDITITNDTEVDLSNYLAKDNTTEFTPTGDYNPATKKYVDDSIENFVTNDALTEALTDYATTDEIPTNMSQLTDDMNVVCQGDNVSVLVNDAGYITSTEAAATYQPVGDYALSTDIPTNTSDLTNDSGYVSSTDVEGMLGTYLQSGDNITELTNNAGYITSADIPTNVSAFTNDAGYITSVDIPDTSNFVTQETLDTYYDTSEEVDEKIANLVNSAPETLDTLSELAEALGNDPNFATTIATQIGEKLDTETAAATYQPIGNYLEGGQVDNVSELINDAGYITSADVNIPENVSAFTNDAGYITSDALSGYAQSSDIPTDLGDLTNTPGYITETEANSMYLRPGNVDNVSELINDAGYITSSDLEGNYATVDQIPTNTSDLTNDSGFITSTTASATYQPIGDYLQSGDNVSELSNDAGYITESALTDYVTNSELESALEDSSSIVHITERQLTETYNQDELYDIISGALSQDKLVSVYTETAYGQSVATIKFIIIGGSNGFALSYRKYDFDNIKYSDTTAPAISRYVTYTIVDGVTENATASYQDFNQDYIEVTFAELTSMAQYAPGVKYCLTDYQCAYIEPVTSTERVEDASEWYIVLTAISSKAFAPEVQIISSSTYEDLRYSKALFTTDKSAFSWTSTVSDDNYRGTIYRLIDRYNNDVEYDFKHMRFARYAVTEIEANLEEESATYASPYRCLCRNTDVLNSISDERYRMGAGRSDEVDLIEAIWNGTFRSTWRNDSNTQFASYSDEFINTYFKPFNDTEHPRYKYIARNTTELECLRTGITVNTSGVTAGARAIATIDSEDIQYFYTFDYEGEDASEQLTSSGTCKVYCTKISWNQAPYGVNASLGDNVFIFGAEDSYVAHTEFTQCRYNTFVLIPFYNSATDGYIGNSHFEYFYHNIIHISGLDSCCFQGEYGCAYNYFNCAGALLRNIQQDGRFAYNTVVGQMVTMSLKGSITNNIFFNSTYSFAYGDSNTASSPLDGEYSYESRIEGSAYGNIIGPIEYWLSYSHLNSNTFAAYYNKGVTVHNRISYNYFGGSIRWGVTFYYTGCVGMNNSGRFIGCSFRPFGVYACELDSRDYDTAYCNATDLNKNFYGIDFENGNRTTSDYTELADMTLQGSQYGYSDRVFVKPSGIGYAPLSDTIKLIKVVSELPDSPDSSTLYIISSASTNSLNTLSADNAVEEASYEEMYEKDYPAIQVDINPF